MIHFIANHWLLAIVLAVGISVVAGVLAYALCGAAAYHDKPNLIEPGDLSDPKLACAWCARERAAALDPNESHSICDRHAAEVLAESKRFKHAV